MQCTNTPIVQYNVDIPYSAKAHNFHGSCKLKRFAETIFAINKILLATPFHGSRPIREKRENYAPRIFGTIRYMMVMLLFQDN